MKIDDRLFEVRELSGSQAVIMSVEDLSTRAIALGDLLATSRPPSNALPAKMQIGLEILTAEERADLDRLRARLEWIEDPQSDSDACLPKGKRVAQVASDLGVSARTIQRKLALYNARGEEGLVSGDTLRKRRKLSDSRWEEVAAEFLSSNVQTTTMARNSVISEVTDIVRSRFPDAKIPSQSTCYAIVKRLDVGREYFGTAKARRSIARAPQGSFGKLSASRPGEILILDTHTLDVLVRTLRKRRSQDFVSRPELTVAIDVYTRAIVAIVVSTTTSQDVVSAILFEACQPSPWPEEIPADCRWNFHGVPDEILISDPDFTWSMPYCPPDTVITDRGRPYISGHVHSLCEQLGISINLAQPYTPTDKAIVERFFRSLNSGLIQKLPGYVGSDVLARGENTHEEAVLSIAELDLAIRRWICSVYHVTVHSGLVVPEVSEREMSPAEIYQIGIQVHGLPRLLIRPDDVYDFLTTEQRTIQAKGVTISGRVYDGPAIDAYRYSESGEPRAQTKRSFRFKVDPRDIRYIHFQDPVTLEWHQLTWTEASRLDRPFSQDEAQLVKEILADPLADRNQLNQALTKKITGEVKTDRRENSRAKRIAQQLPTATQRIVSVNSRSKGHEQPPTLGFSSGFNETWKGPSEVDTFEVDMGWGEGNNRYCDEFVGDDGYFEEFNDD